MRKSTQIAIPTLVRIKAGALDRIGVYAKRGGFKHAALFLNKELDSRLSNRVAHAVAAEGIAVLKTAEITSASFEQADEIFHSMPSHVDIVIGFGGGKAMDVAKYVAFLLHRAYIAMPTSLSNDAFCSPQVSLDIKGRKKSCPATMPYGVVVDTEVCLNAPQVLWWSGIGDLISKLTAVTDWKLAHKKDGTQINDFAALLSDSTVFQFMANPTHDLEGVRLLATALMLNGIAMGVCGSSRPASGSEHLISHALDIVSKRPRLHGLQVGMATYIVSQLQGGRHTARIASLFDTTGFWNAFKCDPLSREEWANAFKLAPSLKSDFYTILSERDQTDAFLSILDNDIRLQTLFLP
jgi:glycerol-1-phosphate dehydrogenase [NAD(P)+]